jgi:hypothetical protein
MCDGGKSPRGKTVPSVGIREARRPGAVVVARSFASASAGTTCAVAVSPRFRRERGHAERTIRGRHDAAPHTDRRDVDLRRSRAPHIHDGRGERRGRHRRKIRHRQRRTRRGDGQGRRVAVSPVPPASRSNPRPASAPPLWSLALPAGERVWHANTRQTRSPQKEWSASPLGVHELTSPLVKAGGTRRGDTLPNIPSLPTSETCRC